MKQRAAAPASTPMQGNDKNEQGRAHAAARGHDAINCPDIHPLQPAVPAPRPPACNARYSNRDTDGNPSRCTGLPRAIIGGLYATRWEKRFTPLPKAQTPVNRSGPIPPVTKLWRDRFTPAPKVHEAHDPRRVASKLSGKRTEGREVSHRLPAVVSRARHPDGNGADLAHPPRTPSPDVSHDPEHPFAARTRTLHRVR